MKSSNLISSREELLGRAAGAGRLVRGESKSATRTCSARDLEARRARTPCVLAVSVCLRVPASALLAPVMVVPWSLSVFHSSLTDAQAVATPRMDPSICRVNGVMVSCQCPVLAASRSLLSSMASPMRFQRLSS